MTGQVVEVDVQMVTDMDDKWVHWWMDRYIDEQMNVLGRLLAGKVVEMDVQIVTDMDAKWMNWWIYGWVDSFGYGCVIWVQTEI